MHRPDQCDLPRRALTSRSHFTLSLNAWVYKYLCKLHRWNEDFIFKSESEYSIYCWRKRIKHRCFPWPEFGCTELGKLKPFSDKLLTLGLQFHCLLKILSKFLLVNSFSIQMYLMIFALYWRSKKLHARTMYRIRPSKRPGSLRKRKCFVIGGTKIKIPYNFLPDKYLYMLFIKNNWREVFVRDWALIRTNTACR